MARPCTSVRVQMPVQDGPSAYRFCTHCCMGHLARARTLQGAVDTDPSLISYRHRVGYCRSPGILASPVTRSIGWSRMSLWSTL
ncbi:MAG TPA: hypothetical protein VH593_15945, partial [Ktedonobacteraceae bacterium]